MARPTKEATAAKERFNREQLRDQKMLDAAEKALEETTSPHALGRLIGSMNAITERMERRRCDFHGVSKSSDVDEAGFPTKNPAGKPFDRDFSWWKVLGGRRPVDVPPDPRFPEQTGGELRRELLAKGDTAAVEKYDRDVEKHRVLRFKEDQRANSRNR
jgi:hypothetical protein